MTKLQKVKEALEQMLDDLSHGSMEFPNSGVCEATWNQAKQALAELEEFMERLESEELVESLASIEHEQWIRWSSEIAYREEICDDTLDRWRDYWVPYSDLPEKSKEHDRVWARKALAAINVIKEC